MLIFQVFNIVMGAVLLRSGHGHSHGSLGEECGHGHSHGHGHHSRSQRLADDDSDEEDAHKAGRCCAKQRGMFSRGVGEDRNVLVDSAWLHVIGGMLFRL